MGLNHLKARKNTTFEGVPIGADRAPLKSPIYSLLQISSQILAGSLLRRLFTKDGITYLINAMRSGIVTPLTSAYEAAILAETGARNLAAALAAVRPA